LFTANRISLEILISELVTGKNYTAYQLFKHQHYPKLIRGCLLDRFVTEEKLNRLDLKKRWRNGREEIRLQVLKFLLKNRLPGRYSRTQIVSLNFKSAENSGELKNAPVCWIPAHHHQTSYSPSINCRII